MSADEFRDAIRDAGLTPPDAIEPGRFYRFPGVGKSNGNKAGWCKLFDDEQGGVYGDYSRDLTETWRAKLERSYTAEERAAFKAQAERSKAEADAKRREEQNDASARARELWQRATVAGAHPYLTSKGVCAHGVRIDGDALLVPMRDSAGELVNVQRIAANGTKRFLPGARVTACYHAIGKPDGAIGIAEGYATAASIHEATGLAVAVAFNAGNLEAVARELRKKYPDARIVVCGDDDNRTPGNPGLTKATEAARAVGGKVAIPDFGADRPEGATDFNDLAQHHGAEAVKRAVASARAPDVSEGQAEADNATASDAWPELQPLEVNQERAPYPIAALPTGIRQAVEEVVAFVQCPVALAACSALSALSLAGQALADVRRAEHLSGPCSLYLLAIADSGERKTTCDNHYLEPVREWQHDEAKKAEPGLAAYAAKRAAWEEQREGLCARIRGAAKKSNPTENAERELADIERERPAPPRVPRVLYGDATPEALASKLALGWPSGGVMSSEAGIVFGAHGMKSDNVMRNLSLLNALWDGGTVPVDRKQSESFTLTGARLTMGLAAQRDTVRAFMEATKGLARGNGFAARFLVAWPESTQGKRPFKPAEVWRDLPAFHRRLRELLALTPEPDDDGRLALPMLDFDAEASAAWIRFHDDVEAELDDGGAMTDVRDVASKAADNVARLAALCHLYAHGPTGRIDAACVTSAASVVGWHLYEARRFLGEVAAPRERSNARRLDAWLIAYCRREGVSQVRRRTIQNVGPNSVRSKFALDAAIAELIEAGRVRKRDGGKWIEVRPELLRGADGAA